jgi:hypothetical protein
MENFHYVRNPSFNRVLGDFNPLTYYFRAMHTGSVTGNSNDESISESSYLNATSSGVDRWGEGWATNAYKHEGTIAIDTTALQHAVEMFNPPVAKLAELNGYASLSLGVLVFASVLRVWLRVREVAGKLR